MAVFDDVTLEWRDASHTVPARKVFGLLKRIEDVITLQELYAAKAEGTVRLTRLAEAYGAALRYAGATIRDDEVYEGLFPSAESQVAAWQAIDGLLGMLIPPSVMRAAEAKKVANQGNELAAAEAPS